MGMSERKPAQVVSSALARRQGWPGPRQRVLSRTVDIGPDLAVTRAACVRTHLDATAGRRRLLLGGIASTLQTTQRPANADYLDANEIPHRRPMCLTIARYLVGPWESNAIIGLMWPYVGL